MGFWDAIKSAASKVVSAVTNVVTSAAKVVYSASKVSPAQLATSIAVAKAVSSSAEKTSDSANTILITSDKEEAEKESDNIKEEIIKIQEAVGLTTAELLIKQGLELLTGKRISVAEFRLEEAKVADWIIPINTLTILFTGKNLKGEAEEFGATEHYFDLAATALMFVPITRIPFIGAKIAEKTAAKGLLNVTEKMALKKATPAQIEAILKTNNFGFVLEAMRIDPRSYAKMASKFTKETQALISTALEKQHPKTAFRLFEKALEVDAGKIITGLGIKITKPSLKTAAFGLAGISGLIGLAYGIPFGTSWFAKEGLDEILRIPLSDRMRDYRRDPTPEKLAAIKRYLEKLDKSVPAAKKLISSVSWMWPFTKFGWDTYIENLEFEVNEVKKELEIIEIPLVPEEEKWALIEAEREEKREQERIADEERWNKIIEESEARKAEARAEEQERWNKIIEEQQKRREEARIVEEKYWAALQEQQELAKEEERIADFEYWAFINEQNRIKKEEERIADEEYWANIYAQQEAEELRKTGQYFTYEQQPALSTAILDTPFVPYVPYEKPAPPVEKEILVNIETTDAKPWKGRIFSIAWLDLSMPGAEPLVIVDDNEEEILRAFMAEFEREGFTKIWGFKTIFDYRYIFNKLMLYRMQSKSLFDAELGDVKQLLDQVKEAFVYFPDRTGKLDDYGKELLGVGKYGTQENLLKRYIAGDVSYVERFQLQQIKVTQGLYDLFRFSAAGSSPEQIQSLEEVSTETIASSPGFEPGSSQTRKCPNCLAEQPISAEFCDICKIKL